MSALKRLEVIYRQLTENYKSRIMGARSTAERFNEIHPGAIVLHGPTTAEPWSPPIHNSVSFKIAQVYRRAARTALYRVSGS